MYEAAKEAYFKGQLTPWESHTITVFVTATFATITAFFIRSRTNKLNIAIKEAHAQAADVIDQMFDAVIIIDKQGLVVTFNPAAEIIFEIPASKAIGKNFTILLDDRFSIEYEERIKNYSSDKNSPVLNSSKREVFGRRASGEVFPMELMVSSMVIKGRLMFLGVARDATESKRAESELARLREIEQQIHDNLRHEVSIAATIQMSMIPRGESLYPDLNHIKAYGITKPAKEMGGDFFDAFSIDENHIALAIGDVSGKGVPAALFMIKVMTLLRTSITKPSGLMESMLDVNKSLCYNNDSDMFVTMFVAIMNIHTGELHYFNAGHDNPLIAGKNQEFSMLRGPRNMILGIHVASQYNIGSAKLEPGDSLVLFTDGVTEAEDEQGQLYSIERAKKLLSSGNRMSSKAMVDHLLRDIEVHVNSISQSDDITVLALQYH
ncbi:PP2C family protein-serine/threonine phosphatase [Polynucleobacter sp. MWH-Svant-W18]|uniref:PP2C family protein-serine/threonine phosphatase n=1 Tax=Polynucleobacter sp. MWH-Svant-W18 TaxID=1855909 RepID=UPI001BFCDFE5|nr:SpoIIE family protein phosphatase [Polynucleobacter sp. MWH-Svant-W18]